MRIGSRKLPNWLVARLSVLSAIIVLSAVMIASGVQPALAVAVPLALSAGAVEIACWLTSPHGSLRIRAGVVHPGPAVDP
ncbi:hypothetical protein ACFQ1S_06075 [Kibdelosporangium lantanae]|uniref:DUF2892 domain-containing protein n=1 Tax=Kibdelosporangium lantanae TaxID=1497396 RepID=A0ABW3M3F4_9PSEU